MSYVCSSKSTGKVNLVEQILEQGQRLRNAMVNTILNNDPFYNHNTQYCPKMQAINMEQLGRERTVAEKHRLASYLRGDDMSGEAEKEVLETFRAMSSDDICEVTKSSYTKLQQECNCDTCKAYQNLSIYTDNYKSNIVPPLNLAVKDEEIIPNQMDLDFLKCLQYVDSLKIAVHSLKLNNQGNTKVLSGSRNGNIPQHLSTTYFIEYTIPDEIVKHLHKKTKVDTGLDGSNFVKLCSMKLHKQAIYFKQISLHDIINLHLVNLQGADIKFKVTCRAARQKNINIVGYATFNMASFLTTKYLSCSQELTVVLNDNTPIVLGLIKIGLQLGCGRLYFGKEFLDSLNTDKDNVALPEVVASDELAGDIDKNEEQHSSAETEEFLFTAQLKEMMPKRTPLEKKSSARSEANIEKKATKKPSVPAIVKRNIRPKLTNTNKSQAALPPDKLAKIPSSMIEKPTEEKQILFGFIYIGQVEYLENKDVTYFACTPFGQDHDVYSNLVNGGSNPLFNFHQSIPFIYDDKFLTGLADNFMIFEFYERKDERTELIGICKISLHQYYLAFRNSTILKYLERNKLPVIGTDWYEPISDPGTGVITGQAQVLVAVGSQQQIKNLENERGFRDSIVKKAKNIIISKVCVETKESQTKSINADDGLTKAKLALKVPDQIPTELNKLTADKSTHKVDTADKGSQYDISEVMQKQREAGTNTDMAEEQSASEPAILVHSLVGNEDAKPDTFRARIAIKSASNLPSRKKCTGKYVLGKFRLDELLPSTYVSFETGLESDDIHVTKIVNDSASPVWNHKCDVSLPTNLLNDNQKRLIFKVWKTFVSDSTLKHDMRTDPVLGFAALDLTVLAAGLPAVEGFFNIVDLSDKCNGQLKISVTPLEKIEKYNCTSSAAYPTTVEAASPSEMTEEPAELLSRTLKRKFSELDEITQRLRARMSNVTKDESDTSNDDMADEFEKDINTICLEDEDNSVDFAKEAQDMTLRRVSESLMQQSVVVAHNPLQSAHLNAENSSLSLSQFVAAQGSPSLTLDSESSSSVGTLSHHLSEGKQRIDTLLQKLTLISSSEAEPFSSRYVSGCSVDTASESSKSTQEEILSELGISNQFDASVMFDDKLVDVFNMHSALSDCGRCAPDGEGNANFKATS